MAPCAVFVAEHGQIDPGPDWVDNCANPMNDDQHAVDIDLDGSERKDPAEFYWLNR